MLSPIFWLVFLATFFVVKAVADTWLDFPVPMLRRRRVASGEPGKEAPAPASEPPLRRAA